jgi:hypothetical protein
LDPDSVDPDLGGQKLPTKIEGLDVMYGGLGISKLQLLSKKYNKKILAVFFPSVFGFGHQNSGSGFP